MVNLWARLVLASAVIIVPTSCWAARPLTLKDKTLKRIFVIESDREHACSIDEEGNLHWSLDLASHAVFRPAIGPIKIVSLEEPTKKILVAAGKPGLGMNYLLVRFNTGEYGLVNRRTARYAFAGK